MPRRSSTGNGPNGQVASGCRPKDHVVAAVSSDADSGWVDAEEGDIGDDKGEIEEQQKCADAAVASDQPEAEEDEIEARDGVSSDEDDELEIFCCESVTDSEPSFSPPPPPP